MEEQIALCDMIFSDLQAINRIVQVNSAAFFFNDLPCLPHQAGYNDLFVLLAGEQPLMQHFKNRIKKFLNFVYMLLKSITVLHE